MSVPWLKFFPSDWRADPKLRSCSMAARGLWMEMICLMHEAEPRGFLLINGKPVTEKQIANLAGIEKKEVASCMVELEIAGVFSRDEHGVIYSRRMAREEEKASKDKANGKLGGNPKLVKGVNPPDNVEDKTQKPEARSQIVEGGGSAPARGQSLVSEEAFSVVQEVLDFAKIGTDHPLAYGAPLQVQAWLNEGTPAMVIIAGAKRALANKRDGPPTTFAYFRNAVARERARSEEPLPEVRLTPAPKLEVIHGRPHAQPVNFRDLAETLIERGRAAREQRDNGSGLLPETSGDHTRFISEGGS